MNFSIARKIYLVFILIILGLLGFHYFYLSRVMEEEYLLLSRQKLVEQINLIDGQFKLQNAELTDAFADQLGAKLHSRLSIIDLTGRVIGDSQLTLDEISQLDNHASREELIMAKDGLVGHAIRRSDTVNDEFLYVVKKFPYGYIRLANPLRLLDHAMNSFQSTFAASLMITALIGLGLIFFNFRPLKRFIDQLDEFSSSLSSGNFKIRLNQDVSDERGLIAKALNDMARSVGKLVHTIEQEKNYFRSVLESVSDGVLVVDAQEHIVLINDTLKQQFKKERNPDGLKPLEYLHNQPLSEAIRESLESSKTSRREIRVRNVWIDKVFLLFVTPLQGQGGAVAVFHDITTLKQLEDMRRDFVANVSHEFKTPLTSILGYAETILEHDDRLDDMTVKFVQTIHKNAHLLRALVDDVLNLSHIESGQNLLNPQKLDLHHCLHDVSVHFRKKLHAKNVSIQFELAEEPIWLEVDKKAFDQIINNMIDNAIKYNKPDGKIIVRTRLVADQVEISISDTGIGVAAKDQDRVFERFYRGDPARAKAEGTGLGLSIVKHLVQAHKGTIVLNSRLDHGSTFIISLPLVHA